MMWVVQAKSLANLSKKKSRFETLRDSFFEIEATEIFLRVDLISYTKIVQSENKLTLVILLILCYLAYEPDMNPKKVTVSIVAKVKIYFSKHILLWAKIFLAVKKL